MISGKYVTLIRLALVNSIGFGASTVLPLWVGGIAAHFQMPAIYAAVAATSQILAAACLNFFTPWLFRHAAPVNLAIKALIVAAVAALFQQAPSPYLFVVASTACGGALGVVLNCTNRLVAGSEHVQEGYSIYQLTEVVFAVSLFVIGAQAISAFGVTAVFIVVGAAAAIGVLILKDLPVKNFVTESTRERPSAQTRLPALMGLLALLVFFIGQSSINSYMLPIGQDKGLSASLVANIIAACMLFGFLGALSARLLGERFGVSGPVIAVCFVLIACFFGLTRFDAVPIFVIGAATLGFCTMFAVPYFFTHLAKLDRGGLYASVGPAFLLGGVAIGPSVSVFMNENAGIAALGAAAGGIILLAAALFMASSRMSPAAASPYFQPKTKGAGEG